MTFFPNLIRIPIEPKKRLVLNYKKMFFYLLSIFLLLRVKISSAAGGNWTYMSDGGTKEWKSRFPTCGGGGKRQSPVDIITAFTFSRNFGPIKVVNYDTASSQIIVTNVGTTVVAELQKDPQAKISGGGLEGEYLAASYHFHWGATDNYGAEHYKDGTTYPMELHIVHYSSKYANVGEAVEKSNGIAVMGFFFTIATVNNTVLQGLIDKFPLIQAVDSNTKFDGQLGLLLPKDRDKYFLYYGSLTTPPCSESVVWVVFDSTIPVSALQMTEFRTRLNWKSTAHPKMMFDNYRELQPLYQREIFVNKAGPMQHKALIVILMIGVHFL